VMNGVDAAKLVAAAAILLDEAIDEAEKVL
jgi:hypothetical protein